MWPGWPSAAGCVLACVVQPHRWPRPTVEGTLACVGLAQQVSHGICFARPTMANVQPNYDQNESVVLYVHVGHVPDCQIEGPDADWGCRALGICTRGACVVACCHPCVLHRTLQHSSRLVFWWRTLFLHGVHAMAAPAPLTGFAYVYHHHACSSIDGLGAIAESKTQRYKKARGRFIASSHQLAMLRGTPSSTP